jgi:hypothetical protein
MYCDGCGSTIGAGMQYCNTCGKRILGAVGAAPTAQAGQMAQASPFSDRVRRNIQLLAGLWLAYGILRLLNMFWLLIFGRLILPSIFGAMGTGWWGLDGSHWGGPLGSWVWPGLFFGGVSMAFFAVAYLILAWGLYEKRPWARTFGLILGFLVLLRIPFGTALGIYTIWTLLPESSRREYDALAKA